ncbi:hypothetical protein ASG40_16990 [Methylobacterium sp. Leaf399]|uniref:hypothetical protein n=1 Tax=Methylobacterium sp. Leaf399 TaxID=1736364 RepID=UPI0006F65E29|nr:hypothetical protein [Methylobacterium sp. Leaf399]KQT17717.1 hypothetical protein ASG40_16990 [Methylobacterium sp. Leaf399]
MAAVGSASLNHAEVGQPEWRSALLAEAIRHTAHVAGPINPFALHRHLQDWVGIPEEACGGEINTILFAMVRSGLYTSNTHDEATGTITMGVETRLTASRTLTVCLHGEPCGDYEETEI